VRFQCLHHAELFSKGAEGGHHVTWDQREVRGTGLKPNAAHGKWTHGNLGLDISIRRHASNVFLANQQEGSLLTLF
jgi:hypothetical protein